MKFGEIEDIEEMIEYLRKNVVHEGYDLPMYTGKLYGGER